MTLTAHPSTALYKCSVGRIQENVSRADQQAPTFGNDMIASGCGARVSVLDQVITRHPCMRKNLARQEGRGDSLWPNERGFFHNRGPGARACHLICFALLKGQCESVVFLVVDSVSLFARCVV